MTDELKEKAVAAKVAIKKEKVTIDNNGSECEFRITGVGQKAVKIEKFISYDDIIQAIEEGNDNGLEAQLKRIIEEAEVEE